MLAALVVVGACGRVEFDTVVDGRPVDNATGDYAAACDVITHDEDGDLRDDRCDLCPHVPDPPQLDGDGDQVGDACDPEPAIARQQLVLFDPFVTLDPAWQFDTDERAENDTLVLDAINVSRTVRRPYTLAHDTFEIAATTGAAGANDHLVALITSPQGWAEHVLLRDVR